MKKIIVLVMLLFILVPCFFSALPAHAIDFGLEDARNIGLPGDPDLEPKEAAVTIVQYLMTFLGIIAVIVMLWGGFQWLTAGGNESRVESAKKTIIAGIIGLIIVIASYAIVTLVVGFAVNIIEG